MDTIDRSNRAIGLVSIGNPITLIASFEQFKEIIESPKYKIYVYLNVPREHTSAERFEILTNNAYKIAQEYKQYFKDVVIIENTTTSWITHGQAIDMLFHIIDEEYMAIFEEDAYMFSRELFDAKLQELQTKDLVCVVAPQNPNNFQNLFSKLSIFPEAVNMPGKESVFFIRKSIAKKYNWLGFDYVKWTPETVYKRPEGTKLAFKEEIHFDTFEFFSFNCWMNTEIKSTTYTEENFDYWILEGRNDTEAFYRNFAGGKNYIHYFNGALFQYLDYLSPKNKIFYKNMLLNAEHFGAFLYHLSTCAINLSILNAVKSKYIQLLGKQEYLTHKNSLKNSLRLLFSYFGVYKIRNQFKFYKYIKFTHKFAKKYHGVDS
jgi:hypothetical protein